MNAGHTRVYENRLNVTICRHVRLSAYRTVEDYCPLVVALPQICRNLEQMVNIRTRQHMVGNSKNFRKLYIAFVVFTLHILQRVAGKKKRGQLTSRDKVKIWRIGDCLFKRSLFDSSSRPTVIVYRILRMLQLLSISRNFVKLSKQRCNEHQWNRWNSLCKPRYRKNGIRRCEWKKEFLVKCCVNVTTLMIRGLRAGNIYSSLLIYLTTTKSRLPAQKQM